MRQADRYRLTHPGRRGSRVFPFSRSERPVAARLSSWDDDVTQDGDATLWHSSYLT